MKVKNKLQELLIKYDSENIEVSYPYNNPDQKELRYRLRKDFKKETGIHHNRISNLFKDPNEEFSQTELVMIARYLSKISGKEVKITDLIEEVRD